MGNIFTFSTDLINLSSTIQGPNKKTQIIENQSKRYTPISRIDQKGSFELLIKVYRPNESFNEGGIVSQFIDKIEVNDYVNISGPAGKIEYLGNGEMLVMDSNDNWIKKKYKNIGFIAAGTGITPIYQVNKKY